MKSTTINKRVKSVKPVKSVFGGFFKHGKTPIRRISIDWFHKGVVGETKPLNQFKQ